MKSNLVRHLAYQLVLEEQGREEEKQTLEPQREELIILASLKLGLKDRILLTDREETMKHPN